MKLKQFPNLEHSIDQLPIYDSKIPAGLLIDGNCPLAIEPLSAILSNGNSPSALKTRFGWCNVGRNSKYRNETMSDATKRIGTAY